MAKTPPSYTRGKYNVTKQSPKVNCPVCDQEVYSRGLYAHMKLAHRQYDVPKQDTEGITGLKTTKKVKKKTRTSYDLDELIGGLLVIGVGSIVINEVVEAFKRKQASQTALLVKKPN